VLSGETGPLPGVELRPGGAHYAVLDQGAHVLAWQPAGERPVLWVSARSLFEPGAPVRGGIPVVFPWFGAGPDGTRKPAHGYARTTVWERTGVIEDGDRLEVRYWLAGRSEGQVEGEGRAGGDRSTAAGAAADAQTGADPSGARRAADVRNETPNAFPSAELTAEFSPSELVVTLAISNETAAEVTVEAALHTYLAVGDIREVSIEGLEGCSYLDTVAGGQAGTHSQRGAIRFSGETDRLYEHTGTATLHDPAWDRTITVRKRGSATTVVWNPWVEKAARTADLGDDEWQGMLCIEAANVRASALTLAPGSSHAMAQMITVGRRQ